MAILVRQLGAARLPLVEDVVQDALMRASQMWPYHGLPPNPTAWLLTTARNRAHDLGRRDQRWRASIPAIEQQMEHMLDQANATTEAVFEEEIRDAELRMMFVCCHPGLADEAQLALILKTLGGFGEREIAAAFLVPRATIAKRLVRARRFLRDEGVTTELPSPAELADRRSTVLHALYLLFNEGYKASTGEQIVRAELCAEAHRLLRGFLAWRAGDTPESHALAALFCFHRARLAARTDDDGDPILIADQNRGRWDKALLRTGMRHLSASAAGDELTRFHVEAGIASYHCVAPTFGDTNWRGILALYEQLHALAPSSIVTLNHAVALGKVDGAAAALKLIEERIEPKQVAGYHLYHAVRANLLHEFGANRDAIEACQRALELAPLAAERRALAKRLASMPRGD